MSNIILELKLEMLIPILEMCKEYFDGKYPATTEENDGSEMSASDEAKFITYNHLLAILNNNKRVSHDSYVAFKNKIKEFHQG